MFLDWKNQYYQNDYTTQGNPQIQNHLYLITNGIFDRIITKKLNLYRNTKDPEQRKQFLKKIYLFIFGCAGSLLMHLDFLSCSKQDLLFTVVCGLLVVASLVAEHGLQAYGFQQLRHVGSGVVPCRLQSTSSVVVVHRFSCHMAYWIFLEQRSNPCPLYWQVDS